MAVSTERTKRLTNSANGIQREIRLSTVTRFEYLGAVVSDDGSLKIAQATVALTKRKPVRRDNNFSRVKGEIDALSCYLYISAYL